jgi:hypothetical protein
MPRKLRLLTVSARSTRLRPPSIGRSTAPRNGAHSPARRPGAPGRACVRGYSVFAIPLSFVRTERMATPSSSVAAGAGLWRRRFSDLRRGAQLGRDGAFVIHSTASKPRFGESCPHGTGRFPSVVWSTTMTNNKNCGIDGA